MGRHVRVVVASTLGAVIVVSLAAVLFSFSPGLNEGWVLRQVVLTVGGAFVVGVVVAAMLVYLEAEPATVARVTRKLPAVTASLTAVILLYRLMQGLASQG